jgi:DMSO/TMAO reductase YedYZ molybdopterin-dependent catalytic subunit
MNVVERVGADLTAKRDDFHCNHDFTEDIDLATALPPQTILATHYANETIADSLAVRCVCARKLGCKNTKRFTRSK